MTGHHPKVYLRLLLVEDTVLLTSPRDKSKTFTRAFNTNVVRAVAHRPPVDWGLPISAPGTVQYTFDVAALQRRHLDYYKRGVPALLKAEPASHDSVVDNPVL